MSEIILMVGNHDGFCVEQIDFWPDLKRTKMIVVNEIVYILSVKDTFYQG